MVVVAYRYMLKLPLVKKYLAFLITIDCPEVKFLQITIESGNLLGSRDLAPSNRIEIFFGKLAEPLSGPCLHI